MFTGIITDIGTVRRREDRGDLRLWIETAYDLSDVDMGASIACSGACLTVVAKEDGAFAVDVSAETVSKTVGAHWHDGARLNLERALKIGDELGGHIVTGHVDAVGKLVSKERIGDSHEVWIEVPRDLAPFLAPKGSVTLDGASLTVNRVEDDQDRVRFSYNLIPHTADLTTHGAKQVGDEVNVEIDTLARYLHRMSALKEGK
ncbi:riboflavin synthase [Pacificimonas flava]|uniref:Riboflavin synthase n=2 Tax=Pacificimonas TaxID=1960290 RepID=A0A219B5I4_9SPHN|nr:MULTISPECIES: riboflavin synthase [Pacificimonas]MBZ6379141.1 riboflavin synthase [Pacificimonas aurantium]OWV33630.1 riboflavin synthase [Pacificimonas flava]